MSAAVSSSFTSDVVAFVVDVSRCRWSTGPDQRAQEASFIDTASFILECIRSSLQLHAHLTHPHTFGVYHIDEASKVYHLVERGDGQGSSLLSDLHRRLCFPLQALNSRQQPLLLAAAVPHPRRLHTAMHGSQ